MSRPRRSGTTTRELLVSPLLGWAVLTGLVTWGAWVLWHTGLITRLTTEDPSRISWVILAIYCATQLYAGRLAIALHRDSALLLEIAQPNTATTTSRIDHPLAVYIARRRNTSSDGSRDEDSHSYLHALLGDRLSSGWFIADLMFKLGLIGTVIGFIMMLGAITDLRSMDIHQAQSMLGEMSAGMRLALYTTLTGLGCGALTGLQFHLLERSVQALAQRAQQLIES
jgi:hypothetical protein